MYSDAASGDVIFSCLETLSRTLPQTDAEAAAMGCTLGSLIDEWAGQPSLQRPELIAHMADLLTGMALRGSRTPNRTESEAARLLQLATVTQIAWLAETVEPFAALGTAHLSLIARTAHDFVVRDQALDNLGDLTEGETGAALLATGEIKAQLHANRDPEMRRRALDWLYCRAEHDGAACADLIEAADHAATLETRPELLRHIFDRMHDAVENFPQLEAANLSILRRRFEVAMLGIPGVPSSLAIAGIDRIDGLLQSRRKRLVADTSAP